MVAWAVGFYLTKVILDWLFVPFWLSLFNDYVADVEVELYTRDNMWYLFPLAYIVGFAFSFIVSRYTNPYVDESDRF